jgi:hypothetical protein
VTEGTCSYLGDIDASLFTKLTGGGFSETLAIKRGPELLRFGLHLFFAAGSR